MPTNMIHGWQETFWRLEDELAPDSIYFFDKGMSQKTGDTSKLQGKSVFPPEGFSEQLEWVKKLTLAIGYQCFEESGAALMI